MTGLHTGHTYVRGNQEVRPEGQTPMKASVVTLAEKLKDAGYTCGGFGKWGLGAPGSEGDPIHQGFDRFFGYNCQRQAHSYYPDHLWSNLDRVELDGKTYAHDLIMEEALKFIKENRAKPFFCYLPVTIPHAAMHVPESYSAPFRKKFSQFENKVGRYKGPKVRNPIAAFAGMMTKLDEDVGRVVKMLDELEIREKTLVMLTSDNGPHQEGGHNPKFFDSNGPLRGFKRDLYEGGIRAPMIANWPGKIAEGSETDHLSAHWDVWPTLCEIAEIDSGKTDGISFLPTLLGRGKQEQHSYLYWEFYERGGRKAVRFGDWKAVLNDIRKKSNPKMQLFHLKEDLGETNDVADQYPELVEKAQEMMAEAHSPSEFPKWTFNPKKKKN